MLAPHQREAADRAERLLDAHGGALLADEPGLGKSWVAAEVMRRRGTRSPLELIAPAALQAQWRATLAEFGVDARFATHDAIPGGALAGEPRPLVVVDEAHAFRNPATARHEALARRTAGADVLLITATPVCNSAADLHSLLRILVADDVLRPWGVPSIDAAFERGDPSAIEAIVSGLVIRRGRDVLAPALAFGVLERRVVRHRVPDLGLDRLRFPLVDDASILRRLLLRRLESSHAALAESLRRQVRFYQRALSALAAGRTLTRSDYRRAFAAGAEDAMFQEVLFWELFAPAGRGAEPAQVREEIGTIEALLAQLRLRTDDKRAQLMDLLAGEAEPVLVFSGSAATAHDVWEAVRRIRRAGLVTARERRRDAVLAAFRAGRLDVVVSTDMAAEGFNLQRAGVVVHYDIPWNPVKLDQRNGRAFRIGQRRASVRAVYFLPESRETRIVETIARKNRTRRRILAGGGDGGGVGAPATIRPRLTRAAAFVRLFERAGPGVPDVLARRHKAGIELLLAEAAEDGSGAACLAGLAAMAAARSCGQSD